MANTPLSGGSSPSGSAGTILAADDSVTMQRVIQMTFAAEDFSVTTVSSAAEAIARAKEMKPDIVLADLSMVGRNGYDICADLKADEELAQVPVLLLHGSSAPYDETRGNDVQADGQLKKPFDTQVLIDKVKSLTAGRAVREARPPMGPVESLSSPIETEDVVIDTDALAAKVPAAPAMPTPRPIPPAAKPAVARPPVSPPARPQPAAAPTFKASAPKPAMPTLSKLSPPEAAAVEITIEAEPPPREGQEPLPSFDEIQPGVPVRPDSTMLGIGAPDLPPLPAGLPPPPTGMPLPPAGMPLPPLAVPPTAAGRGTAARPAPARSESIDPAAYEAIAKLSREIIEKIVWEVVPDLAEKIIREELDRLVEKRR